jgi:hypothetical protein
VDDGLLFRKCIDSYRGDCNITDSLADPIVMMCVKKRWNKNLAVLLDQKALLVNAKNASGYIALHQVCGVAAGTNELVAAQLIDKGRQL